MKHVNKIFSILLPVLFLAFSLYPCMDRFELPVSSENTSIQQVTAQHDSKSAFHSDGCSPLCACTCCAASTMAAIVLDIQTPDFLPVFSNTPIYYEGNTNDAFVTIWQPPKLA